ncbi:MULTISPECIES: FAD-dependent oxidoreductase [unclassified Roseitalea]|uniref:GcvT family protein n=1 Tax=unclassified Roseitalea TaxID=2639107 RepID=UPI00273D8E43|nr:MULTISPECIES: FAD-dependent oxidoreductase [unclassified Roseitalea]
MKTEARAVVIGGGVVGVSTLYHLARKGWSDVVLVERRELTSGSTWHAAGLLPLFNLSYSVSYIHKYSVGFYPKLQEETGMNVGFSRCSNIRLAQTPDRWDEYMYYKGIAETLGIEVEVLTPDQVKAIWPLCETDGLIGAIRHPDDGYIQPADLTQALAKGARDRGATIHRNTTVTGIDQRGDGRWVVTTDKGAITCDHVVSATGNFARRTGAMVGLNVPVIPVEHQFIVTEPHPAIRERHAQGLPEMGVLRDSDSAWYMREEAGGLLLGPYEAGAPACYVDGPAADSEYELFQEDLERITAHIESAIVRVPAFGEVGVKQVYNGAIAYTPDGSPIIGPAPGLKNFWLSEGHSFGVTAAGGAGWQLAEWIVEGEPSIDMMGVDPRRFGPYADEGYLIEKNEEAYANVFTPHYPEEERPAGRPLKTSPSHDRQKALGAVFGSVYGWERANWFAPSPDYQVPEEDRAYPDVIARNHLSHPQDGRIKERLRFGRSNAFAHIGAEVRNVHDNVGLLDMTAFAKCWVSGPGAEDWLNRVFANRVPARAGRIALCHVLTKQGGVRSEFTVYRRPDGFYLVSAGALETHDHDVMNKLLPEDGSVRMQPVTAQWGVLVLAGPRSRQVLQKLTRADMANEAFRWLSGRPISVGRARCHALRVNFVGELGWELHHPIEMQNYLYDTLMQAGAEFGIRPFGIRAMTSMAVEKSYRLPGRELSIEYNALESGLDRFVKLDKPGFIGKAAVEKAAAEGLRWRLVTLEVHDVDRYDPRGSEAITDGQGALIGRATSGAYGWRVGKSLALAMVRPEFAGQGTELRIKLLGQPHRATVIAESPFDPKNIALRS